MLGPDASSGDTAVTPLPRGAEKSFPHAVITPLWLHTCEPVYAPEGSFVQ